MRLCLCILVCVPLLAAQTPDGSALTERERTLLERIERLEQRLAALEAKAGVAPAPAVVAAAVAAPAPAAEPDKNSSGPSFVPGTTLNLYFDGYYGYNFNRPVGRENLLHSNDVHANNFTLNQVGIILERAPDVAAGRRYGARVDLMFGANTDSFQGSALNEPRPDVYRNIYQAYGTYVFPVGSGLTVDFGKFYNSLGVESNYASNDVNYSRSLYFALLPGYHMGFRTTYNVSDKLSVQHWLVNGVNQTEDFNGFKSNAIALTIRPTKAVTWNANYYVGQESHDLPATIGATSPSQNGRTHIVDTYASWAASEKLTLAAEYDYVVARQLSTSAPSHVAGGAGYLKYQFTPKFSLGGRYEYLGDHGGLFSSTNQNLKESTVTVTYQPQDGMQMRLEFRRDWSDRPFFLTATPGLLKKEQNTATLGMIWWFGGKKESW